MNDEITMKPFRDEWLNKLFKLTLEGEWEKFCFEVTWSGSTSKMDAAVSAFYDMMPDSMKYDFIIDLYSNHGDSSPKVRQALRCLRKYGKPKLPDELKDAEFITVYRGGNGAEDVQKAKYCISWTTDKDKAFWFRDRKKFIGDNEAKVFSGIIKPEKVIAYNDDREEKEIMQYRNVRNIIIIG